jgi:hypothetical protein
MSARPFYETIYHCEGWTLADAFRPQPGWGTRAFTVKLADLPEHTEQQFVDMARQAAPDRYRLTSVTLYPAEGEKRVIWSTPPCPTSKALAKAAAGVRVARPTLDVDALAQEIRRVDGSHSLGAGALAEALLPFIERANGVTVPGAETFRTPDPDGGPA